MKRYVLLLLLALTSCDRTQDRPIPAAVAAPSSAELGTREIADASGGVSCPAQDFGEFVSVYTEDEAVQRAFTHFPLETLFVRNDGPGEPEPQKQVISRDEAQFPLIPGEQARSARHLRLEVALVQTDEGEVELFKPDTDFVVNYRFEFRGGCWYLVRIEDWSL